MKLRLSTVLSALILASTCTLAQDNDAPTPAGKSGVPTPAAGVDPPTLADVEAANKKSEDDDVDASDAAEEMEVEVPVNLNQGGLNSIVIELIQDDRILNGELLDVGDLTIETAFGPASIPLLKVLGIRMARTATETTTVVLHNGDMITGQVDIKSLMIRTKWGKSELNGANLASIFFGEGLSWESLDLLAGPRWTLAQTKPASAESSSKKSSKSQALAVQ